MPYIKKERRVELGSAKIVIQNPGELNYLFTSLINDYLQKKGLTYQTINDVLGSLEGAKLEFYRRVAVPYEIGKISENGDVY